MTRRELISFAANLSKHPLLRLDQKLRRLRTVIEGQGVPAPSLEYILQNVQPFHDEVRSRTEYHASALAELLYDFFEAVVALRNEIRTSWRADRTAPPDIRRLRHELHMWDSFVPADRRKLRPMATRYLKMRY
jgi:hypothetical protein